MKRRRYSLCDGWSTPEERGWAEIQSHVGQFLSGVENAREQRGVSPTRYVRMAFREHFGFTPHKQWPIGAVKQAVSYQIMLQRAKDKGLVDYGNKLLSTQQYNDKSLEARYSAAITALPGFIQQASK